MSAELDKSPVVAAVTSDTRARADLARQLPGDSVLLFFPDQETAARMLAEGVSRLASEALAPTLSCGGLVIDSLRLQASWNDIPLHLTRLERQLLSCLAAPPIRAWTYERLYRIVWGDAWLGDASAVHATVKRLRRKLRLVGATVSLEVVRGVGFRLET